MHGGDYLTDDENAAIDRAYRRQIRAAERVIMHLNLSMTLAENDSNTEMKKAKQAVVEYLIKYPIRSRRYKSL